MSDLDVQKSETSTRLAFPKGALAWTKSAWLSLRDTQALRTFAPGLPAPVEADAASKAPAASAGAGSILLKSFLLMVVLPTIFIFLYLMFVASNEYVAEARVSVRQPQDSGKQALSEAMSVFGKLGMSGAVRSSLQDAFVVSNYVKSRTIVEDLGGKPMAEKLFGQAWVDFFSRLKRNPTAEDVWRYWNSKVSASVDTPSTIVTIQVRAFRPEDAMTLARSIITASEELINKVSEKSRSDSLRQAESELESATVKLAKTRQEFMLFRNRYGTVDPVATAASIGEQISKLTMERIEIENNLMSLSGTLSPTSINSQLQQRRLAAIDKLIAEAQDKLTNADNPSSLAAQLAEYETLTLNEKFAEKMLQVAQSSYERSRQDRYKQQLYLIPVVEPTLPEWPLFPKVFLSTLFTFMGCVVAWGTMSLIVASVRDHMLPA